MAAMASVVLATVVTVTARVPVVTHTAVLSALQRVVMLWPPLKTARAPRTRVLVRQLCTVCFTALTDCSVVTGGTGGFNESGDAQGGDAAGNIVDGVNTNDGTSSRRKRAQDSGTAGGNAYTGASEDVDGGNVINHSDNDGEVLNDAAGE